VSSNACAILSDVLSLVLSCRSIPSAADGPRRRLTCRAAALQIAARAEILMGGFTHATAVFNSVPNPPLPWDGTDVVTLIIIVLLLLLLRCHCLYCWTAGLQVTDEPSGLVTERQMTTFRQHAAVYGTLLLCCHASL
jgi:hypothetical protein